MEIYKLLITIIVFIIVINVISNTTLAQASYNIIEGYIIDEVGNPVTYANVTLLQNGQFWQPPTGGYDKTNYLRGEYNPQFSQIFKAGDDGGEYLFGYLDPGQYTIIAEKDGLFGSKSLNINNSTEINPNLGYIQHFVNVTIPNYHVPILTQEQLTSNGSISGIIRDPISMVPVRVFLYRDNELVKVPKNPQFSTWESSTPSGGNYQFQHLKPGNYQVRIDIITMEGYYSDNKTILVNDSEANLNFNSSQLLVKRLHPTASPTENIEPSIHPTVLPTNQNISSIPSIGFILIIISIYIAYIINKK